MENTNWNKIQDYFEGMMTDADRVNFEKEMASNDKLNLDIKSYNEIVKGIEDQGKLELLERIHQEEFGPSSTQAKNNRLWWGIGLVLLVFIGSYFFLFNNTDSKDDLDSKDPESGLYASNMPALEGLPVTLSLESDVLFSEAMIAYRMKDYTKSLTYFDQLTKQGVSSDTISIYKANAYIELSEYDKALEVLKELKVDVSSKYYQDALWYEAKVYIYTDNNNRAKENLNFLINANSKYKNEATQVLDALTN